MGTVQRRMVRISDFPEILGVNHGERMVTVGFVRPSSFKKERANRHLFFYTSYPIPCWHNSLFFRKLTSILGQLPHKMCYHIGTE